MSHDSYKPPEWMTDHILDALGGTDYVVGLMSTPRAGQDHNLPLYLLQVDMQHSITLLSRLHDEGLLKEGDE